MITSLEGLGKMPCVAGIEHLSASHMMPNPNQVKITVWKNRIKENDLAFIYKYLSSQRDFGWELVMEEEPIH
jgi:hypothetical protein